MAQLPANSKEFSEETRVASPANFLMKIESFSSLSKYGIDKYESRPFEAGVYKWKLIIYFDENESENESEDESENEERHVSVYFSIAESGSLAEGWEVNAIFTFFVHNQLFDTYHCFRGMTRRFNAVIPKWGLSKLISMENLMDPKKGYIVDDTCVFGAEVLVIKTQRVNECLSLIKDASSYKREWKISEFSKLENVWNSEEFVVGNHNWKVQLYPKGRGSRSKNRYISIFVDCVDSKNFAPHKRVKVEVCMRIKSKLNDTLHSKKYFNWFTSASLSRGFYEFMPICDMSSRGFLVDDCCFLEVEITVQALACTRCP